MNDRINVVMQGALAGLIGTLALQGLRTASQKALPASMPPMQEDPGEFIIEKLENALPPRVRDWIAAPAEAVAAKSLAVGYGISAGAIYAAVRPNSGSVVADGTLLGLGTWAVGYLGWLPASGVMAPVQEQEIVEAVGPLVRHVLFGIATVTAYQWLGKWA